ncbi:hypothetical protein NAEGRDRAFT_82045 [Naegleria gruberi]|uniref:SHOCT domain-containing protein n=1 Tax=Naegleria gruberi TaxID=5762 RepID=D2W1V1_NAEGR|nr:uncharacterized protein NAEGRDRAFT_82045 [Naegleria gruberi]EFC36980.1 hypothetical protein NAEGRDRAFT_82045 [Naegleria gruberi]|eukprot:XP_002669724.1 hypothetical protein NAEGRDRAFT_82045 [Naegleria gruberi strain NEG-M]
MVNITDEQREQIQILQSFLDQGLMDPEDFEEEKKKILSGGSFEEEDEEEEIPIVSQKSTPSQSTTTTTKPTTTTTSSTSSQQRKHIVAESTDDDSDDEPIIKSSSNRIVNNRPIINKQVNNTTTSSGGSSNNRTSNKYSSNSSDNSSDEAVIVSGGDESNSDRELSALKSAIGKKILQDSTTEDEDDDSDDQPIISSSKRVGASTTISKKPSTTTTAAVSSNSSSGYKLNLTPEERDLLTPDQIQQLEKLANLVESEILSEDEVISKKETLLRQQRKKLEEERKRPSESMVTTTTVKKSSKKSNSTATVEEQLQKLQDLLDAGILTDEEYKAKKRQLLPDDDEDEDEYGDEDDDDDDDDSGLKLKLTPQQRDQLSKLDSLLEQGILEQEEYDEKKRQVMGLKKDQAPSKIIENKKKQQGEFGETMDLAIYISNIKATPEKPFKLLYEGKTVMYQREDSTPSGKTVIVRGTFPKLPREDCIVSLLIDMPEANIYTQQNFNLSQHGKFIQILITQEGNRNNIRIKQQHNDSFDTNQLGDKNDQMSRIYLHYAAIPASEDEPFRVWINDMLAHQMTESMTSSQSGVIRGSIPKVKRCNLTDDPFHCIDLRIHIPLIDPMVKSFIVNLTNNGEHVALILNNSTITVKQSKSEKVLEDENALILQSTNKQPNKK